MTVYNEAANIESVLASLLAQSRPPAEIVVVDGGSQDGTPDRIAVVAQAAPQVRCIVQPGANISQGRNLAISRASHAVIAVTDAGTRLPPDWLAELTLPFADPRTMVVAGFFRSDPDPTSPFQIAMGATVLPAPYDIEPTKFLPSSRSVAFRRSAWQAASGYPEWLDYGEDLIFDLNLKKGGFEFIWQPRAVALFAPRPNLRAFWRQYYLYARGDGKAGLFLKRHLLRYFIYGLVGPVGLLVGWRRPLVWPLLIAAGLGYLWKAYRRLFFYLDEFHRLPLTGKLAAIGWVPIIRATGDAAKMVGYSVGRRQKVGPGPQ